MSFSRVVRLFKVLKCTEAKRLHSRLDGYGIWVIEKYWKSNEFPQITDIIQYTSNDILICVVSSEMFTNILAVCSYNKFLIYRDQLISRRYEKFFARLTLFLFNKHVKWPVIIYWEDLTWILNIAKIDLDNQWLNMLCCCEYTTITITSS